MDQLCFSIFIAIYLFNMYWGEMYLTHLPYDFKTISKVEAILRSESA